MVGEPILVMLVEDNVDHAELVIRTLEEHRIANKVRHFLDGQSELMVTGQGFPNDVQFLLTITMDFGTHTWTAAIDGQEFISGVPITTANAALNLGDVDAGWAIYDPTDPGDNYMAFDDYRLTAVTSVGPSWLESLGFLGGDFVLRVHGSEDARYSIDASEDLSTWMPLKTNVVSGGFFEFIDREASAHPQRFYRSRHAR